MKQRKTRYRAALRLAWPLLATGLLTACQSSDPVDVVGTLEWDRIELTADAAEPIVAIEVRESETVAAGQTVLQLDARRVQARLDESRALLAQRNARLAELQRGPRVERITQARATLAGAEGTLEAAQHELNRVRPLVKQELLTRQDLDNARSAYDVARARRDTAQAELAELEHGTTAEELDQAVAARDAAAAAVRGLEVSLERLTVRAPVPGTIDDLPLEPGERPTVGAVVAVLLAGAAPHARVYLPEPLRTRVSVGDPASVYVDGIDLPFAGRVRRISADPAFTPYYSLTERDRSRLSYLTEVTLAGEAALGLPAGIPLRVVFAGPAATE
ncbi:MAG TPA: HlyD family efflux transporter periplasmic adaptor subunit [Gammaproteobacteria bacterium]|nr:HlyD family efflux transporter periplasmic adaptor subunit [Gammaproteobacteria bacterium]